MSGSIIPPPLRDPEFGFCKVVRCKKKPIGNAWQNRPYRFDDPSFLAHLKAGGNYGVICGVGKLRVLDADSTELREAIEQRLPPTYEVETGGGGRHYYYRCDEEVENINFYIDPRNGKVDNHAGEWKSHRVQVVGPGSIHPSLRTYRVLEDRPIVRITFDEMKAALNDFLKTDEVEAVRRSTGKGPDPWRDKPDTGSVMGPAKLRRVGDHLQGPHPIHGSTTGSNFVLHPDGSWHCFNCMGQERLRGDGWTMYAMTALGIDDCMEAVRATQDSSTFRQLVERAVEEGVIRPPDDDTYEPPKFEDDNSCSGCGKALYTNGKPFFNACSDCDDQVCNDCYPTYITPIRCWNCWQKYVTTRFVYEPGKKNAKSIVKRNKMFWFLKTSIKYFRYRDNEATYIYDHFDKVWKEKGEINIKEFLTLTIGDLFSREIKYWLLSALVDTNTVDRDKMPVLPLGIIPLSNGFFDWEKEELIDEGVFDPSEYFFLRRHDVYYDPGAKCPTFLRFLQTSLDDDPMRETLVEWLGYQFYRDYPYHKLLLLVGGGRNGKSTYLKILREVVGKDNVTGADLFSLADNQFAASTLFQKNSNIDADLPDGEVRNTGVIKKLVGGDPMNIERKGKDAFLFENYAKMTFSCNSLPRFKDASDGFWRRPMIIRFPHKFPNKREFERRLLAEKNGIFLMAVRGLKRLMDREVFSYPITEEDVKRTYLVATEPLYEYFESKIESRAKEYIIVSELWEAYYAWCKMNKVNPGSKTEFGRGLLSYFDGAERVKKRAKGGRIYVYMNVMWREEPKVNTLMELLELITELGEGKKGAKMEDLIPIAGERFGLGEGEVKDQIGKLLQRGDVYQPNDNYIKAPDI